MNACFLYLPKNKKWRKITSFISELTERRESKLSKFNENFPFEAFYFTKFLEKTKK